MSYVSIFIKTDTCFYRPFKMNKQAGNPKTAFHSDLSRLPRNKENRSAASDCNAVSPHLGVENRNWIILEIKKG